MILCMILIGFQVKFGIAAEWRLKGWPFGLLIFKTKIIQLVKWILLWSGTKKVQNLKATRESDLNAVNCFLCLNDSGSELWYAVVMW